MKTYHENAILVAESDLLFKLSNIKLTVLWTYHNSMTQKTLSIQHNFTRAQWKVRTKDWPDAMELYNKSLQSATNRFSTFHGYTQNVFYPWKKKWKAILDYIKPSGGKSPTRAKNKLTQTQIACSHWKNKSGRNKSQTNAGIREVTGHSCSYGHNFEHFTRISTHKSK